MCTPEDPTQHDRKSTAHTPTQDGTGVKGAISTVCFVEFDSFSVTSYTVIKYWRTYILSLSKRDNVETNKIQFPFSDTEGQFLKVFQMQINIFFPSELYLI